MLNLEAKQALARKLDLNYADIANNDLFSDADLQEFIQFGLAETWDLHPWPFTEDTLTQPTTSLGVSNGYYDFPADLMLGSVRRLAVNGIEFYGPVRFEDYLRYFESNTGGNDKIWAPHEDFIFINPNAYTVGADIDILGKAIAPTLSADTDLLPFSLISDNKEHSGNKAIIELAYAHALSSEKMKRTDEAEAVRKEAYRTLELLWKPFSEFKSIEQSQNRPMFDVPDFFAGKGSNNSPIGNFNLD